MYLLVVLTLTYSIHDINGILGGHEIDIWQAPYQINYGDVCGGVLIHKIWALTAAHCRNNREYIRVGSKYRLEGPKVKIKLHIIHPKFRLRHQFDYDVQLLKLYRNLHFSKLISDINICRGYCGKRVLVSGWGYSKENGDYNNVLLQINIKIIPLETCQRYDKFWYNHTLTSRMFCAGGESRDACQGDSGAGAVASGKLIGVSSFGFGCGRHYPGVYTNISNKRILSWIQYYTGLK